MLSTRITVPRVLSVLFQHFLWLAQFISLFSIEVFIPAGEFDPEEGRKQVTYGCTVCSVILYHLFSWNCELERGLYVIFCVMNLMLRSMELDDHKIAATEKVSNHLWYQFVKSRDSFSCFSGKHLYKRSNENTMKRTVCCVWYKHLIEILFSLEL